MAGEGPVCDALHGLLATRPWHVEPVALAEAVAAAEHYQPLLTLLVAPRGPLGPEQSPTDLTPLARHCPIVLIAEAKLEGEVAIASAAMARLDAAATPEQLAADIEQLVAELRLAQHFSVPEPEALGLDAVVAALGSALRDDRPLASAEALRVAPLTARRLSVERGRIDTSMRKRAQASSMPAEAPAATADARASAPSPTVHSRDTARPPVAGRTPLFQRLSRACMRWVKHLLGRPR